MTEQDLRWNQFIDDICQREAAALSPLQREAVLCFWYDTEMNSGGHSGYFDCYPDADPEALAAALTHVAGEAFAANYLNAVADGAADDYAQTDHAFCAMAPSLTDALAAFVETHWADLFH